MRALLVLALLVIGGFAADISAFRGEFNSITIGAAQPPYSNPELT